MDGPRLEAAFRKHFSRADRSQTEQSREILVGHGNIFRFFILRYSSHEVFLCYIFTTRKRGLGQGNVFTGVCLSPGVCLEGSACGSALGDLPHLLFFHTTEISKQSHLQRGLHLGGWPGVCPQGFCLGGLHPGGLPTGGSASRRRWVCI